MKHVYEAMADELVALGVRATFGLMGEDTAGLIVDLDRQGVRYYGANHENVAVAMADGYAWASGGVGVAIISRGPGLTNAMTAMTTAAKAPRGVLVVSGAASTVANPPSSDAKRIGQRQMAEAIGVTYFEAAAAADVVPLLRAAHAVAATGRTAQVAVPPNLFTAAAAAPGPAVGEPAPGPAAPVQPAAADVAALADLLAGAERPLVVAGRGALGEGTPALLVALAERTGGLLGTTLLAKSTFLGHPRDLGVIGGFSTATARDALAGVDVVVAFGAGLNAFTRGHGTVFPEAKLVQVDADAAAIGLLGGVDLGVHGDAHVTAAALLDALPAEAASAPPGELLARLAEASPFGGVDESLPERVDPRPLTARLEHLLPEDRVVVMDAGHHFGFPATALSVPAPDRFRLTSSFSAVGMGLGSAMGASVARPGLPTVVFIGDGGLLMTLGDLQTVARYRLPLVIVVLDDEAYGAERHFMDLEGLPHELSFVPPADFAALAGAFGIPAATVTTLEGLEQHAALLRGGDGPVLLECKVNPAIRAQWLEDLDSFRKRLFAGTGA